MAGFHGRGDELQLTFNFPFLFAEFTAPALAGAVASTLAALPAGECPVWTGSNHDVSRFPTRWCGGDEAKARLALLILATLPGTLVLYYGDELAMTDATVPAHLRRDEMSKDMPAGQGRDRARTPMPWDGSPEADFTTRGVTPWLPVGGNSARNVAGQRNDPASTLSFCRELLALRRAEFGGQIASYRQLPAPAGVWAYQAGGLLVAANLTDDPVRWREPIGDVLLTTDPALGTTGPVIDLPPWRGLAARPAAPPAWPASSPG
jgi:alpha-glucosidase